jgi:hypothetical protein
MIRLVCGEQSIEVSVHKAESILHVQKESGNLSHWQLEEGSNYNLINGKLIKRDSSKTIQRTSRKK